MARQKLEIAGKDSKTFPRLYLEAPRRGENRHDRRRAEALTGRKNTRGFPLGYNAVTWPRANAGAGK